MRRKTEVLLDEDNQPAHEATEPESNATGLRCDLQQAMVDLSKAEHAAIQHCYYLDLSHDEAAYALNMPLGTLKTHVLRAKEKMRRRLDAYANEANRTSEKNGTMANAPFAVMQN